MKLTELKTQKERLEALREITKPFGERAMRHEEEGTFPALNFEDLKRSGYPSLTIPKQFGGAGISLTELLELQLEIAKSDGATALGIGWHMGIMKHLGESGAWEEAKYRTLAEDVLTNGALINNAASEPASGSPSWGNRPQTTAAQTTRGWIVNGRKSFTTLAPILDYFVVSAAIEGTDRTGNFLVKRTRPGVRIEETWDSVAMQGTGSHDVVLDHVELDADDLVEYRPDGPKPPQGWLLHIPTAYLGIARAAQREAVQFALHYSPGGMEGTIADIPSVQERMGQIELRLMESETILFAAARKWDESSEEIRGTMREELGVAKLVTVNKAIEAVDLAMRIVGARSLSKKNPLQRHYRDVRAGLHNPPMDDMTIKALANRSLKRIREQIGE